MSWSIPCPTEPGFRPEVVNAAAQGGPPRHMSYGPPATMRSQEVIPRSWYDMPRPQPSDADTAGRRQYNHPCYEASPAVLWTESQVPRKHDRDAHLFPRAHLVNQNRPEGRTLPLSVSEMRGGRHVHHAPSLPHTMSAPEWTHHPHMPHNDHSSFVGGFMPSGAAGATHTQGGSQPVSDSARHNESYRSREATQYPEAMMNGSAYPGEHESNQRPSQADPMRTSQESRRRTNSGTSGDRGRPAPGAMRATLSASPIEQRHSYGSPGYNQQYYYAPQTCSTTSSALPSEVGTSWYSGESGRARCADSASDGQRAGSSTSKLDDTLCGSSRDDQPTPGASTSSVWPDSIRYRGMKNSMVATGGKTKVLKPSEISPKSNKPR